jgi:hypothetical protein
LNLNTIMTLGRLAIMLRFIARHDLSWGKVSSLF